MVFLFKRVLSAEPGVTAIEYAMLGSLITIVIAVAVDMIGGNLSTIFTTVATSM